MTNEQLACWRLMATSLRKVIQLIEAAAEGDGLNTFHDLPYEDMAYILSYVVTIEELVRPTEKTTHIN
jgi:hypothetical protein